MTTPVNNGVTLVDANGNSLANTSGTQVTGPVAAGAAKAGNPVLVGGQDGTNAQTLSTDTAGHPLVATPNGWALFHTPAVATQATIGQAAGGGTVKNVCTSITVALANDATGTEQPLIQFNLRDGATGAGTVKWSVTLALPATAGECRVLTIPVNIVGSANTAMTLESSAAPAAHTAASVSMTGYTLPS